MFKKIIFGVLALLLLAIASVFIFAKDFSVQVSEETAQKAIDAQIKKGPIKTLGLEVSLKQAKIDFRDDNTTAISAEFDANALGYKGRVKGKFQSGIRYVSPRIYLDNIVPVEVDVQTDGETKSELGELKSAARDFLKRQKDNTQNDRASEAIDSIIGESSEDFQESIIKGSYAFFENIPLYNLNNAGYKGSLASLALKDVKFSEDYATITLSPVQALVKILMAIGTVLLVILYLGWSFLLPLILDKVSTTKPEKIISGYVDVPPADRADFALALPEHTRLTNQEPGCHYFRVTPDPAIEGRYLVEEAFDDEAAYTAHMERTAKTKWAKITRNIKRSYSV